jgi:hypothetical protein
MKNRGCALVQPAANKIPNEPNWAGAKGGAIIVNALHRLHPPAWNWRFERSTERTHCVPKGDARKDRASKQ